MPASNTENLEFSGVLKILKGTPNLLLKEYFEKYVFSNLFKQNPVNSFTDVFPAEPVIAIELMSKDFLKVELILLNRFNGLLKKIIFGLLNFLFDTARTAPFFIASLANLFPSNFLPLTPKNIEFLLILFELIDAELRVLFLLRILSLKLSFKIFVLIDFDKFLFLFLIAFKIFILSEKKYFFLYS